MRDDFSAQVKTVLATKAGLTCSNPDCRVYTGGPSENIGVGAHISAASPGGPRYDPSLSPGQRRSEANGIWLCQNCAKLVDSPVHQDQYPRARLRLWKLTAEKRASAYVGRTSPFLSDFRPVSIMHGKLLELSSIESRYQLFEAISGQPYIYSTTSTAREQVVDHVSPSTVLDWGTEIIISCWANGDDEPLGICAILLTTAFSRWQPEAATLGKLESLCKSEIAAGNSARIRIVEPVLFAVAAKGGSNAYMRLLGAHIHQKDWRGAEDAFSIHYYGSGGEEAGAVARHLHDPHRTGLLRANDVGRLISLITKPMDDLSRPRVRHSLIVLLRESLRELQKSGQSDLVDLAKSLYQNECLSPPLSPLRRQGSRKVATFLDSRLRGNDRKEQPSAEPSLC